MWLLLLGSRRLILLLLVEHPLVNLTLRGLGLRLRDPVLSWLVLGALLVRLQRLGEDLAAWGRLARVLSHLQLFNAFDDLDTVEAHFDPEVLLKVCFSYMIDDLSIDSDVLCKHLQLLIELETKKSWMNSIRKRTIV